MDDELRMISILDRWNGRTIYSCEARNLGEAAKRAIAEGANLTRANLTDANLTRANLTDANLTDANLTRANLTDANLTDANLTRANLMRVPECKADFLLVLDSAPAEVPGLLLAIREGRIDGTAYHGNCACLVGTIANLRHCDIADLGALKPDADRPAERWFLKIRPGHLPSFNIYAAFAEQWIVEWMAGRITEVP